MAVNKKRLVKATLTSFAAAGLFVFVLFNSITDVYAQNVSKSEKVSKKRTERKASDKSARKETTEPDKLQESLFLQENEKMIDYVPDIYRCPECGYEQDEPGTCPDHNTLELVKIISKVRDPLEPAELDGNEDMIVDIPLKNLLFKKEIEPVATATEDVK